MLQLKTNKTKATQTPKLILCPKDFLTQGLFQLQTVPVMLPSVTSVLSHCPFNVLPFFQERRKTPLVKVIPAFSFRSFVMV